MINAGDILSPVRMLAQSIQFLDRRLRVVEKRPVTGFGGGPGPGPTPTEPTTHPTLNAGATQVASPYAAVGYWIDPQGTVHLQGTFSSSTFPITVFTLPAGYRPVGTVTYDVPMYGVVDVFVNGDVTARSASTYVSLDGITFRAA